MPRRFKDEEQPLADEFKPNIRDAVALGRDLAKYSPSIIGTRRVYPFEQYLSEKGIIKIGTCVRIILQPMEYHRLLQLNDLWEWKRDKDLEAVFQQFPEEKEIHQSKIAVIVQEIKDLLTGKKLKQV